MRPALLILGAALLAGAAIGFLTGAGAAVWPIGVFGVLLLLGTLFERRHYRPILDAPPGPDWETTGERFRDPASGATVAVWFHRGSGARSYVRVAAASE